MKKRYFVLALVFIMAFSLVLSACQEKKSDDKSAEDQAIDRVEDQTNDTENTEQATEQPSEEPKEPLTIRSDEITAKVGEEFSIFVNIDGSADYENWGSLDLIVSYDPNLYSIDDIVPTELTSGAMVVPNLEYAPDKVKIAIATYEDMPFGQVLELKCTAKAAGECTVEFSEAMVQIFLVQDGTPTTIPTALNIEPFNVTITEN